MSIACEKEKKHPIIFLRQSGRVEHLWVVEEGSPGLKL